MTRIDAWQEREKGRSSEVKQKKVERVEINRIEIK